MSDTPDYISRVEAVRQLGISLATADRWFGRVSGLYRDRCRYVRTHPKATHPNVMVPTDLITEILKARTP